MQLFLNPKAIFSLLDILKSAFVSGHPIHLRTTEKVIRHDYKQRKPFLVYLKMEFALPTVIFDVVC